MSDREWILVMIAIISIPFMFLILDAIVQPLWAAIKSGARRSRELPSQRPKMIGDPVGGAVDTGYTEAEWEAFGYGDNDRWILETNRIVGDLEWERIMRRSPAERVVMENGETYSVYTRRRVVR